MEASSKKAANRVALGNQYTVSKWYGELRVDFDSGVRECLFRGKYRGTHKGAEVDTEDECYIAHVRPDGTGYVTPGW